MLSATLRKELNILAKKYANKYNLQVKVSTSGVILFQKNNNKKIHGNFLNSSYRNILTNKDWKKRLDKAHSSFPKYSGIKELDSCNSSDALLMNIFCHQKIKKWKSIQNLFKISQINTIEFGYKAKILKAGKFDSTEIDMKMNNIIVEAKLTENNFTNKEKSIVELYDKFDKIFNKRKLQQNNKYYMNYQLIRNILAADQLGSSFYLLCDGRRPDLIRDFYLTVICIKNDLLREKCNIIFWQEIAHGSGRELEDFLIEKYKL